MIRLLFILFLLLPVVSWSQQRTPIGTENGYVHLVNSAKVDVVFAIPIRDTIDWNYATFRKLGRITIRPQDSLMYYHNGSKWERVGNSTETDPVFTASDAFDITSSDITNWDDAFGWGNHASAGYLTSANIEDAINNGVTNKAPSENAVFDALALKAALSHGHVISDVTGLQAALDGKAALSHTHAMADLSDFNVSAPAEGNLLKYDNASSKWINFAPTYISGNQTITLSGDASGSGTTGITVTTVRLNGLLPAYYLDRTNHTGSQAISTVTSLQSTLDAKWSTAGNSITAGTDFFGTTNNTSIRFRTNNTVKAVLDSIGRMVIGASAIIAMSGSSTFTGANIPFQTNYDISAGGTAMFSLMSNAGPTITATTRRVGTFYSLSSQGAGELHKGGGLFYQSTASFGNSGYMSLYVGNDGSNVAERVRFETGAITAQGSVSFTTTTGSFIISNNSGSGFFTTADGQHGMKNSSSWTEIIGNSSQMIRFVNVSSSNNMMNISTSENVSIGGVSDAARLVVTKTTEQMRIQYDASNYYSVTVGSTGGVTWDAVGSGSGFTFSDRVTFRAVTATAGTASIVIPSGTLLGTPVAGSIEADNNHIYWTKADGTRLQLD